MRPTTLRRNGLSLLAAGTLIAAPAAIVLSTGEVAMAGSNPHGKVTICHATNSDSHPYVINTPNKDGHVSGHGKHTGPVWAPGLKASHTMWGDIIPPFDYMDHKVMKHFDGLNWTDEGQAWWNNGCTAPTPEPTPTPTETPTPTPTPTPTTTPTPEPGGGGGGGGEVQQPPTITGGGGGVTLPRTGTPAEEALALGLLLVLSGSGLLLLAPDRRTH